MTISNERLVSVAESAKQLLGFPCSKEQLDNMERKTLKRLAVELGQRASRMTDEELIELYNSFDASKHEYEGDDESPDVEAKPDPQPDPQPDPDGESESESEGEGEQPKPSFVPNTPMEAELADLIRRVHESIEHESGTDIEKVQSMIDEQSRETISGITSLMKKHVNRPPIKIEIKKPDGKKINVDGIHHEKSPEVLQALYRGDRVMLVGGAGSGKTYMAQQMHKALANMLDQDDYEFGMSGAMHQAYEVRGYMDANGNYVESSFVKCFRDGGLFLFDEIDGSNPQALVALNASLENEFSDFPCGVIKRHPNFRMIACANTYGRGADREYVGRNQLDGATLDRFKPIVDFDYDMSLELAVTPNPNFTKVVQTLRKAKDDMRIRHIISMRASTSGGRAINDGVKFKDVIENYVLSGLDDDTKKRIISEAGGLNTLSRLNKTGTTKTETASDAVKQESA